jgi:hypothetical protein
MTLTPAGGGKRDLTWNGYKLHVSETCDANADDAPVDLADDVVDAPPNLITNVATTDASVPDVAMTEPIHEDLARRGLLPGEHYLDSGYPSADLLISSAARFGVALITPMLADNSPQARAGDGFDRTTFTIDWDTQQVICPHGQTNTSWTPANQRGTDVIVVRLAGESCQPCPVKARCTTATSRGRQLTLRPQPCSRPSTTPEPSRPPRPGRTSTPVAPGRSPPSLRASKSPIPATPATVACPRPAWNTKQLPSTSSASMPGGTAIPSTDAEPATSHAWNPLSLREPKLTSGVL